MSYCRFSSDDREIYGMKIPKSDVYVFESEFGGIVCCGCKLNDGHSIRFGTYSEMIGHLRYHIAVGQVVPHHVIADLMAAQQEHGDKV